MAQTAAHLADHVIPPVPVRQWVISEPKRLRGMLADRPAAVSALTKIFIAEIQRLLLATSRGIPDAVMPRAARPRLGGISFLHRFGSALNHHVHLHACVSSVSLWNTCCGIAPGPPSHWDVTALAKRECRHATRGHGQRAWKRRSRLQRLLRRESKAPLA